MTILQVVAVALLTADPGGTGWEQAAKEDGITIYSREKDGTNVREMKAVGVIDAAPMEVWKAIRDYPNYKSTMPYTEVSKVLATEGEKTERGHKVTYFYSVVNAPLVDKRDYIIKLTDESNWKDGKGYLKVSWVAADRKEVPEKEDLVRVKINDGVWMLEPREDGKKTYATYYVYTDPGGSIPNWIANKANSTAVPNVFKAIREVVKSDRAKKAAAPPATDGGR